MGDPLFDDRADACTHVPRDAFAAGSVIAVVMDGAVRMPHTVRCETFPATTDQVACARRVTRQALADHPQRDAVVLLVSELATNVVRHSAAARSFTLMIAETADRDVWIAVTDDAVSDTIPQLCAAAPTDTGGRGLRIIDKLTTRWGITRAQQHCAVWCHLAHSHEPGAIEPKTLMGAVQF
jgi:anti-sigma regulatory factor (Ser/Thr protein kinase)